MKKLLLGLVLSVFAGSVFAGAYGTAGCGLGSLVIGDQKGIIQVVAATLNGTGVQTFGITTGTSNCGKGVLGSAAIFIEANKVALKNDIARGEGETLDSLAALYGCKDQIGSSLQKNYANIFVSSNASVINGNIINVLEAEKVGNCI